MTCCCPTGGFWVGDLPGFIVLNKKTGEYVNHGFRNRKAIGYTGSPAVYPSSSLYNIHTGQYEVVSSIASRLKETEAGNYDIVLLEDGSFLLYGSTTGATNENIDGNVVSRFVLDDKNPDLEMAGFVRDGELKDKQREDFFNENFRENPAYASKMGISDGKLLIIGNLLNTPTSPFGTKFAVAELDPITLELLGVGSITVSTTFFDWGSPYGFTFSFNNQNSPDRYYVSNGYACGFAYPLGGASSPSGISYVSSSGSGSFSLSNLNIGTHQGFDIWIDDNPNIGLGTGEPEEVPLIVNATTNMSRPMTIDDKIVWTSKVIRGVETTGNRTGGNTMPPVKVHYTERSEYCTAIWTFTAPSTIEVELVPYQQIFIEFNEDWDLPQFTREFSEISTMPPTGNVSYPDGKFSIGQYKFNYNANVNTPGDGIYLGKPGGWFCEYDGEGTKKYTNDAVFTDSDSHGFVFEYEILNQKRLFLSKWSSSGRLWTFSFDRIFQYAGSYPIPGFSTVTTARGFANDGICYVVLGVGLNDEDKEYPTKLVAIDADSGELLWVTAMLDSMTLILTASGGGYVLEDPKFDDDYIYFPVRSTAAGLVIQTYSPEAFE